MEEWITIRNSTAQISNLGNARTSNGRLLKPFCAGGEKVPRIRYDSTVNECKVASMPVHRLVAEHFIANPENKPIVMHLNGRADDNSVFNLRWMTHSEAYEYRKRLESA